MTKGPQFSELPSLSEIRKAIEEIDKQRESGSLPGDERKILELAAVAMRNSERLVIEKLQRSIIKDMEAHVSSLNLLAKEIRSEVREINKTPRNLDKMESVIKTVLKIIGAVAQWL